MPPPLYNHTYLKVVKLGIAGELSAVLDLQLIINTSPVLLAGPLGLVLESNLVGVALGLGHFGSVCEFL